MPKKRPKSAGRLASISGLRCARYLRCSTDDQALGDFTTIDAQDELTLRHVATNGASDAGRYADEGRTGTNLDRPDWKRLIADARAGKFQVVVITYMSRLGRGDAYTIAEYMLKECGVSVVMVKEDFTDDVSGYAQKKMTNFLDGMYPVQVRQWTITKMTEMFYRGYHVGGRIPFGFVSVAAENSGQPAEKTPCRLDRCENNAPVVIAAFDLFVTNRSYADVRAYLEKASGRDWTYSMVQHLLMGRYYIGEAQWGEHVKPEAHPAIVELAMFEATQGIIAEGSQKRARKPVEDAEAPYAYYLRGLLTCACGSPMTTTWARSRLGKQIRYYQCLNRRCDASAGSSILRVNADRMHRSLIGEISAMAAHPWRSRMHIERAAAVMPEPRAFDALLASAERQFKDADHAVAKLTDAVAAAPSAALPALLRRIASEEEKRTAAQSERDRLQIEQQKARWRPTINDLVENAELISKIWQRRTDEERQHLLGLMVDTAKMESPTCCEVTLLAGMAGVKNPDAQNFVVSERQGLTLGTIEGG